MKGVRGERYKYWSLLSMFITGWSIEFKYLHKRLALEASELCPKLKCLNLRLCGSCLMVATKKARQWSGFPRDCPFSYDFALVCPTKAIRKYMWQAKQAISGGLHRPSGHRPKATYWMEAIETGDEFWVPWESIQRCLGLHPILSGPLEFMQHPLWAAQVR